MLSPLVLSMLESSSHISCILHGQSLSPGHTNESVYSIQIHQDMNVRFGHKKGGRSEDLVHKISENVDNYESLRSLLLEWGILLVNR